MKGFTLVELLVVIVIIMLLAALLLPVLTQVMCSARQSAANATIDQLSQASVMYYNDFATYPPGDGSGTSSLTAALSTMGPKKMSYFEFQEGVLDASGNVKSPIRPDVDILYYKNQRALWPANQSDPTAHNRQGFDFWCRDCKGDFDGVNNWGD